MNNTPLSEREEELIKLVATGASNKEISQALHISVNTVKVHLRNIFNKLEVASRTEAAMWAVQHGLVDRLFIEDGERAAEEGGELSYDDSLLRFIPRKFRPLFFIGLALVLVVVGFGVSRILTPEVSTPPTGEIVVGPDFEESRWKQLADMPTARAGLAAAAYDNRIYAIAGEGTEGVLGANERYDPATDTWDILEPKPIPVADIHAGVVGGQIFIPGGRLENGDMTDALEIFDPRTATWTQGAPVPLKVSGYALTTFEGRIYLFGGFDGENVLDTVFIYDPRQDVWSEGTPMPTARAYAGAAEAGGKIYVVGGWDGEESQTKINIYSPRIETDINDPWIIGPTLSYTLEKINTASVSGTIYILGFEKGKQVFLSIEFPLEGFRWTLIDLPFQIGTEACFLYDDLHLYIQGGKVTNKPISTNLSYQVLYQISIPAIR